MARKKVSLKAELENKGAELYTASSTGVAAAEAYRKAAQEAEAEAIVAAKHADAVTHALNILEDAGVVL